ncbi:MAG TPA: hypothetical protein VFH33_06270 [Candidatus Krumholzibacteria bacterium]|nr:hypothetical protein [Candidatus Krumholzibacteria bacterium]
MATNCMEPEHKTQTNTGSGCEGPYAPERPYDPYTPQAAYWARQYTTQDPITVPIHDIWTESSLSAYVVGDGGTIMLWLNGMVTMTSGTTHNLYTIWGSGAGGIFAAGDAGTILHYDVNGWIPMESPTASALRDLWSVPGEDVFAVGDGGTILRYKDKVWTPMTSGVTANLHAVWGTSTQNVYAVGDGGTVLRYSGLSWQELDPGTERDLLGVWVDPGGSVAVVGRNGTFLTHTSDWKAIPLPAAGDLVDVWGTSFGDLHLVSASSLFHLGVRTVEEMTVTGSVTGSLTAINGKTGSNVMAVSEDGSIYKYYPSK